MSEIRITINESSNKEKPLNATLLENEDVIATGIFDKEKFMKIISERIDFLIAPEPDLQLCAKNIEALANAIKRIDKTIEHIINTIHNSYRYRKKDEEKLNETIIALNEKVDRLTIKNKVAKNKKC